jgi:hypothetical protein
VDALRRDQSPTNQIIVSDCLLGGFRSELVTVDRHVELRGLEGAVAPKSDADPVPGGLIVVD